MDGRASTVVLDHDDDEFQEDPMSEVIAITGASSGIGEPPRGAWPQPATRSCSALGAPTVQLGEVLARDPARHDRAAATRRLVAERPFLASVAR